MSDSDGARAGACLKTPRGARRCRGECLGHFLQAVELQQRVRPLGRSMSQGLVATPYERLSQTPAPVASDRIGKRHQTARPVRAALEVPATALRKRELNHLPRGFAYLSASCSVGVCSVAANATKSPHSGNTGRSMRAKVHVVQLRQHASGSHIPGAGTTKFSERIRVRARKRLAGPLLVLQLSAAGSRAFIKFDFQLQFTADRREVRFVQPQCEYPRRRHVPPCDLGRLVDKAVAKMPWWTVQRIGVLDY
jgi:hypothetical protein